MDFTKLLDKVLSRMVENKELIVGQPLDKLFTEEERPYVWFAADKIVSDGLGTLKINTTEKGGTVKYYRVNLQGLKEMQDCPDRLANRPYERRKQKEIIKRVWEIAKIVAVVINALAVLFFAYLTYQNDANPTTICH